MRNVYLSLIKFKKWLFLLYFYYFVKFIRDLGIGIFVPLFFSLTNSDHVIIEKLRYIHPLIDNNFNYFLLLSIFLIFFFKFLLSLFINFKTNIYIFKLYEYLTQKSFRFYINLKYSYFFKKNTSEITRNIYSEIGVVINQIIFNIIFI